MEDAPVASFDEAMDGLPASEPQSPTDSDAAAQLVATRVAQRANRQSGPRMGWMALASCVVAVIAGAVLLADTIVEIWPPAKRLYAMVNLPLSSPATGLEIRNIQARYEASPAGPRLVIEGDIVNISNEVKAVPPLQVALRNEAQEVLTDWLFVATDINMIPNEIVTFRTSHDAPPENAIGAALGFSSEPPPENGPELERSAARE
jgi:hypothetical protein